MSSQMVEFRPHTMSILTITAGYQDTKTGDWIKGNEEWSDPIKCRYEPNGTGQQIRLPDGVLYTYSYVVYLDPDNREYPQGAMVRLYDKDNIQRVEQSIRSSHKGQLNTKLWL